MDCNRVRLRASHCHAKAVNVEGLPGVGVKVDRRSRAMTALLADVGHEVPTVLLPSLLTATLRAHEPIPRAKVRATVGRLTAAATHRLLP